MLQLNGEATNEPVLPSSSRVESYPPHPLESFLANGIIILINKLDCPESVVADKSIKLNNNSFYVIFSQRKRRRTGIYPS